LHSEARSLESAVRECLSPFLFSRELQSHQLQRMGLKPLQTPRHTAGYRIAKMFKCLMCAQISETEGKSPL
jgi:hypothetical protein